MLLPGVPGYLPPVQPRAKADVGHDPRYLGSLQLVDSAFGGATFYDVEAGILQRLRERGADERLILHDQQGRRFLLMITHVRGG